jgi:hypothetical protein
LVFLAIGCVILVILIGMIYIINACRHCRQLIYVQQPVRYRLLSNNNEGSTNNLVASDSENDEEIR